MGFRATESTGRRACRACKTMIVAKRAIGGRSSGTKSVTVFFRRTIRHFPVQIWTVAGRRRRERTAVRTSVDTVWMWLSRRKTSTMGPTHFIPEPCIHRLIWGAVQTGTSMTIRKTYERRRRIRGQNFWRSLEYRRNRIWREYRKRKL